MNHKKIAELAHVSVSTVSKALSGSSEVSRETAEKIRRIAIENGYFKEKTRRKRSYTNNSSLMVAVIVPEVLGFHYAYVITQIKNEVESRGGSVAVYIDDFDKEKQENIINSIILRQSGDGIMLFTKPKWEQKFNIPIVCCDAGKIPYYDSVGCSGDAILDDTVKHLMDLGHTNIGFVGERHTVSSAVQFQKAMERNRLPFKKEFVYTIDDRFEAIGIKAAQKIIAQKKRPSALVCAYDEVALALCHELSNLGLHVPDDISVIGKNNIPASAISEPPLTTVDIFSHEQFKIAVDLLLEKIHNEHAVTKQVTVRHKLIPRNSVKCIK